MTPELIAGRYRVVRAVGRGGMGTVWLCRDELLGREVAVKQIGMLPGESAPDAARALREARSSAALNHRNVVSVFDIVDPGDGDDGHAWLVMEYVPSRTLSQITRDEGPMDPQRVARIGAQVADGLAAAHAAGTIHRDVKPGNILVTEDDVAKISDFGIARGAGDDQLTRTGLVTGTPSYFSPELARGEDPGPESDVYALGATLYAAVEGRPPYPEQRNAIVMLQKIASEDPPPPSRAGALADPIARMMDRDPDHRWTMAEAAAGLHRVAEHGDAAGQPTAVFEAPAAAAAPGWEDDAPGAPVGRADEDDRRRGRLAPWLAAAAVLLLVILGVGYIAMSSDDDADPQAAGTASESPSASKDAKPKKKTPSATPEPTPTPTPTPTPSPAENSGNVGAELEGAVREYFSLVPEDTDAGWQRLAPSMQSQGREAYDDWWDSVDSVDLHQTRAVNDEQVEIELTYTFDDGSAKVETQRLTMQDSDRGYLIADDEVLSSRTVS